MQPLKLHTQLGWSQLMASAPRPGPGEELQRSAHGFWLHHIILCCAGLPDIHAHMRCSVGPQVAHQPKAALKRLAPAAGHEALAQFWGPHQALTCNLTLLSSLATGILL
jgi:hypothetical protein